ncbi:lactosylceramide 4-alpha-galactosyltransferase-like [Convolutriloba macropyga]|uniref:lactosylceramide 4-alpha-galactosyltransferase-like n=1 Tax=Convolutriloba macropyga TaxID=536237 RepID=UPI003F52807A
MRASLLYKYGGFYLDNDVLTLKDLTGIRNSLVIDYRYSVPSQTCELQNEEKSNMLNQGSMHFEKGNPFLFEYLKILNKDYRHGMTWIETGPPLMNKAANLFLGRNNQHDSIPVRTPDLTIFPSFVFRIYMPNLPPPSPKLFDVNVNTSVFDEFMRCSYLIHLSGPWSKNSAVDGNPRHDIYSYLGPKICPTSFSHLNVF